MLRVKIYKIKKTLTYLKIINKAKKKNVIERSTNSHCEIIINNSHPVTTLF